jgi:hypothetical protein
MTGIMFTLLSLLAVDFIHRNFSKFILHSKFNGDIQARKDILTELILNLLRVNGTPLIDVTIDINPKNSSTYIGVIRVPQRSGLLPQLVASRKKFEHYTKWVRFKLLSIIRG